MKQPVLVRFVKPRDSASIAAIYKPYVENTAVSFEYVAPDAEEMLRRIMSVTEDYPYFVAVCGDKVIGYAYAAPFNHRAGYSRCAELSVYVDSSFRGRGAGRLLYAALEKELRCRGVKNLYACIAYPDNVEDETLTKDSVHFHYACGYSICGYFKNCGYKFGRCYSMVWMEKHLY